jgi:hypothetical protein
VEEAARAFRRQGFLELAALAETGVRMGWSFAEINLLRLRYCTHYVFEVVKP